MLRVVLRNFQWFSSGCRSTRRPARSKFVATARTWFRDASLPTTLPGTLNSWGLIVVRKTLFRNNKPHLTSVSKKGCHCWQDFFAQSMHIKLASPQAAWVSIFFVGKSVVLRCWRTHYWEDREDKKSHHLVGFEPMTSKSRGMHSTTVLPKSVGKTARNFIQENQ